MRGCILSAVYEREFRGIVSGDADVLASVSKSLSAEEKTGYDTALRHPFLVVRAAGSLGADLVALRHDVSFLVEVKSSKEDRLYFSDSTRLVEQIDEIRRQCERSGVLPLYAFRLKKFRGDAWRLFTLPRMDLSGPAARLGDRLPKIERTAKGNDLLVWANGLPLHRFLADLVPAPRPQVSVATAQR